MGMEYISTILAWIWNMVLLGKETVPLTFGLSREKQDAQVSVAKTIQVSVAKLSFTFVMTPHYIEYGNFV